MDLYKVSDVMDLMRNSLERVLKSENPCHMRKILIEYLLTAFSAMGMTLVICLFKCQGSACWYMKAVVQRSNMVLTLISAHNGDDALS